MLLSKIGGKLKIIEICIGLLGIISFIWSYIAKLTAANYILFSIPICLFLLFNYLHSRLKRKNENAVINESQAKKQKKAIVLLKILTYSMLVPLALSIYYIIVISPSDCKCEKMSSDPLICITRFSEQKDDEFSYSLTEKITNKLSDKKLVSVCFTDTFLNHQFVIDPHLSSQLINQNCHEKGIVVFGRRSENSKLFNCTIVISEFFKKDFLNKNVNDVIKLKNPDNINFSIEKQTDCVARFMLSVCSFYSKNYKTTINYLNDIDSCNEGNADFVKVCNIFKAQSLFAEGKINDCIDLYNNKIIKDSPTSTDCNNLAQIYLLSKDSTNAFINFEKAKKIDSKIVNPLNGFSQDVKTQTFLSENTASLIAEQEPISKLNIQAPTSIEKTNSKLVQITYIVIGSQKWALSNLNVDNFRNGDPVPHAKTKEEWISAGKKGKPAWCYYDNNPSNNSKYGKLYNWYAVNDLRGLAPNGYHISSDLEITTLINYLGKKNAAKKMKNDRGWFLSYGTEGGNGSNESQFTATPGGARIFQEKDFAGIGGWCIWWTSTQSSKAEKCALAFGLSSKESEVTIREDSPKYFGYYVRCIKD